MTLPETVFVPDGEPREFSHEITSYESYDTRISSQGQIIYQVQINGTIDPIELVVQQENYSSLPSRWELILNRSDQGLIAYNFTLPSPGFYQLNWTNYSPSSNVTIVVVYQLYSIQTPKQTISPWLLSPLIIIVGSLVLWVIIGFQNWRLKRSDYLHRD